MIFTDLGSYLDANLNPVLPWEILLNAGVEGAIFKGCQEDPSRYVSTKQSILHARAFDVQSVGCFYWSDPTVQAKILRQVYRRAIEDELPDFLSTDIEQRKDWQGNWIDPNKVSDEAQELTEGLAEDFPELVMLPYSAHYMVDYAPKLSTWIDKFDQWTAEWPDSPQERYRLSLDEIKRLVLRRTLYGADGKPIRNPDGTYQYVNMLASDPTWNPATNLRLALLRQYSSRIMLPWELVGGTQYDHQYDWSWTIKTIDEWIAFTKKETAPMAAAIEIKSILQEDRATVFPLRGDQTLKLGTKFKDLGADAFVLPMGGMDRYVNAQPTIYSEATFKGRLGAIHAEGFPVIGSFQLYPGYYGMRQYGDIPIKNQSCNPGTTDEQKKQSVRDNIALPYLLSSWADGAFTMDKLFNYEVKWLPIEMLELGIGSVDGFKGVQVNDFWMGLTMRHLFQPLNWLMLRGYIPAKTMSFYCGPWILGQYSIDGDLNTFLANAKDWLYMSLAQTTQFNVRTVPTLKELWQYRPEDSFRWKYNNANWSPLDGYQTSVWSHEYAADTLSTEDVVDENGRPSKVTLRLANTDQAGLYKLLNWSGLPPVEPPVEPPIPGKINTLAEAIAAIEDMQDWRTQMGSVKFPTFPK